MRRVWIWRGILLSLGATAAGEALAAPGSQAPAYADAEAPHADPGAVSSSAEASEAPEVDVEPDPDEVASDAVEADADETIASPADEAVPPADAADEVEPELAAPSTVILIPGEAPKAAKKKLSVMVSDDLEIRYWRVPQRLPGFEGSRVLDYGEQVNRFTARIGGGAWSFYGQLDQVALFANSYFLDDVRQPERELLSPGMWSPLVGGRYDPATHGFNGFRAFSRNVYVNLEKVRLNWRKGQHDLSIGDEYVAFGRGIALNLNRNVDIDVDTSLQGMRWIWQPGAWDVTAVYGQLNRQQVFQDNPNLDLYGDLRHTVGGVRVERFGLGPANIGAHGVVYSFVEETGIAPGFERMGEAPDVVIGGATAELLGIGPTDWYVEADGFAFPTPVAFGASEPRPGYALYTSGTYYGNRTTWQLEAKRYYQSQRMNVPLTPELYQVAIGPTLEYERAVTEDSAAALASNDIWGGRLRMDWTAIPTVLVPYVSMAVFRDLDRSPLHFNQVPETIFHPLIGVEWTKDDASVIANAGQRIDLRDDPSTHGMDTQLHADVLARIPTGHEWFFDVSFNGEYFTWGNNTIQQTNYVEIETAYTLQKGSIFAFTWYLDVTTNPIISSVGNLADAWYGAGEVQVKPLPALTLKAFFGAYKAGIRCSGGQCRVLPGFEGFRVSATGQF